METTAPTNMKFTASSFLPSEDASKLNQVSTLKQVHPYLGLDFSKYNFGHLMTAESSMDKLSNFTNHLNANNYSSARPVMFSNSLALTPYVPHRKRRENKPRRQRTTFSSDQTLKLEMEYRRAEYVTRTRRLELADDLNLTETQIKIWYQNRRAKDKRIEKAHIDQHIRSIGFNNLPTSLQYSGLPPSTLPSIYGWDPWMLRTPLNDVNKV